MSSPGSIKRAYKRSTILWPLALIVSLVILKTAFEHHPAIRKLEEGTYQFMHLKLIREGIRERPDVLVIDISSKIQQETRERDGRTERITPREPLEKLIGVFTDLGARSIGVDVDFSPENGQWKDPGDPGFFDRCLKVRDEKHIPIFLGVERTRTQPDKWLGDDRYMSLAAAIASPVGAHQQAVLWFSADKARAPLLSMGAALADYQLKFEGEHSFWSWAMESISLVQRQPGLHSAEFTIDFASLDLIEYGALTVLTPEQFGDMKDKIRGRMILIGDTRPTEGDLFPIVGLGNVPGVFLHACAAHTLARHPLYHLTLWGRLVLDFVTGVLLFGMVQFSLWMAKRLHSNFAHAEHLLSYIFAVLAILIVAVISVYWVHKTRLLWTDFVLFCAGLLAHPIVDSVVAGGRRLFAVRPKFFVRSAATSGLVLMMVLSTACEQKTEITAPAPETQRDPSSPTPAYRPAGRTAEFKAPAEQTAPGQLPDQTLTSEYFVPASVTSAINNIAPVAQPAAAGAAPAPAAAAAGAVLTAPKPPPPGPPRP